MEPQENSQHTPVMNIPPIGAGISSDEDLAPVSPAYSLQLVGGFLTIAMGLYGFLLWAEPSQAVETHVAGAATVTSFATTPFDELQLQAQSAFVVNLTTSSILHTHNADVQLPLASITKVALVLAISEVLSDEDIVEVTSDAVARGEGGLTAGELWRVKDLIDYTLVASSNVGAETLAEAAEHRIRDRYSEDPDVRHDVSYVESATVWRMNQLAKELGLTKTYFLNASGLDISPTQPGAMSSARDATILLAYAHKTRPELFRETAGTALVVGPQNGPTINAENTNDAIGDIPGLVMGKTGFTDLAGGNLGIVFQVDNQVLVATVMGSTLTGRFDDMLAISRAAQELR